MYIQMHKYICMYAIETVMGLLPNIISFIIIIIIIRIKSCTFWNTFSIKSASPRCSHKCWIRIFLGSQLLSFRGGSSAWRPPERPGAAAADGGNGALHDYSYLGMSQIG